MATLKFGLIGHPLGHSFSRCFFTEKFAKENIDAVYENFDIDELTASSLYKLLLLNPDLCGFNVTSPYKELIIPFIDELDPLAEAVGAVNTVKVLRQADGLIKGLSGYNTDVVGFKTAILPYINKIPECQRCALILGTGGASKAVGEALNSLGIKNLKVSRTPKCENEISYSDIDIRLISEYPVIINATPLGTYPDIETYPNIPYDMLGVNNLCFDLVYNPNETTFMKKAAMRGATVVNGIGMLHKQALAAWNIWTENIL